MDSVFLHFDLATFLQLQSDFLFSVLHIYIGGFHILSLCERFLVSLLGVYLQTMAPLLDIVYSSEEKEKLSSFISSLLHKVFPYLRDHRYASGFTFY